ncbi:SoxR reducing system RseC family protein [Lutibacter sp.]|uniref:SoxR reducing system RseC family protein n=1 Tax=Lutibacter sp. TaxID=1925666 RepID=UPI002733CA15|nr:SoxR reducing system RseC family protein [Lutibacter sp.]MDP3312144.1 SoxR reducing system RseC family protein [Lutibacter sp.]
MKKGKKTNIGHIICIQLVLILIFECNDTAMMSKNDLKISEQPYEPIIHKGIVSKIDTNYVKVSFIGNVNCEGCKAQAGCGVADAEVKEIEVYNIDKTFFLNEEVSILMSKNMGLKAVFWAYILPFILLVLVLILSSLFVSELAAFLFSILILIPYYLTLYVLKDVFKQTFNVSIIKSTKE